MATTGAYRQMLQQVFAIPIEEDSINNTQNAMNNNETVGNNEDSMSTFDEFAEEETKPVEDYTEADIDEQFANF